MKKLPKKTKFQKSHKIKTFKGSKAFTTHRHSIAFRLQSPKLLSYELLETARKTISRTIKPKTRKKKKHSSFTKPAQTHRLPKRLRPKQKTPLYIRSHISQPLTKKPLQVRMGKGKGAPSSWVFPANQSRVIFEISRQRIKLRKAKKAFDNLKKKIPQIKFSYLRSHGRRETYRNKKNPVSLHALPIDSQSIR